MLLDTSGLLSLQHKPEPFYDLACSIYDGATFRLTYNYVLAEFVAPAHVRGVPRRDALTFCAWLLDAPMIEVAWLTKPCTAKRLRCSLPAWTRPIAFAMRSASSLCGGVV